MKAPKQERNANGHFFIDWFCGCDSNFELYRAAIQQCGGNECCACGRRVHILSIIAKVSGVAAALSSVASSGGLDGESVAVIVKAIGIAYTTQIAAALCRDLGETALAVKTELIGRIMLMTLAVPLILKITEMLTELVRNSFTP